MDGHKSCRIDLYFGDGEYTFGLGLRQIAELEEKCGGDGIGAIFARVLQGRVTLANEEVGLATHAAYRYRDLRETIRLGLIGGGSGIVEEKSVKVDAVRALKLVERYVDGNPTEDAWKLASAILHTACQGYEEKAFEPMLPGEEAEPEEGRAGKTEAAAGSTTPSLSETAGSSESGPRKQGD